MSSSSSAPTQGPRNRKPQITPPDKRNHCHPGDTAAGRPATPPAPQGPRSASSAWGSPQQGRPKGLRPPLTSWPRPPLMAPGSPHLTATASPHGRGPWCPLMAGTHLQPLSPGPSEAPQPCSPLSEPLLQPEVRAKQHLSRSSSN